MIDPDLIELAVCKRYPSNLWFNEDEPHLAKALCAGCPIRNQCLQEAVRNEERYGIWGGLTTKERRMFGEAVTGTVALSCPSGRHQLTPDSIVHTVTGWRCAHCYQDNAYRSNLNRNATRRARKAGCQPETRRRRA